MANNARTTRRYILMSDGGFSHPTLGGATLQPSAQSVEVAPRLENTPPPSMKVIDSVGADGPKLVEMAPEAELSLRLQMPHLKLVPEIFYERQWYRPRVTSAPTDRNARAEIAVAAEAAVAASVTILDAASNRPLAGAHVVAFTDFAVKAGASGDSAGDGTVTLAGLEAGAALDRVYVYGPPGYWSFYAVNVTTDTIRRISLAAIDLSDPQLLLRQLYGSLPLTAGTGVTVGVIDTGIDANHPALSGGVSGGLNCVGDEVRADPAAASDWGPAATDGQHGTHVAGIIAARGPAGFHGVAPGAKLRSYRVFPNAGGGASNFDIVKALDAAVADGCGVINMSLGGPTPDDATRVAIGRALAAGTVVIVASGNDGHHTISFPAAFPESVAVSAMGRKGSFPATSIGTSDITTVTGGPGGEDFVADFSNVGPGIDAVGPGVAIVSTLPDGKYGAMNGTSMATPAVSGFAAYVLSEHPELKQLAGADRSKRLKDLLYASCRPEGFGRDEEGFGLPMPAAVA